MTRSCPLYFFATAPALLAILCLPVWSCSSPPLTILPASLAAAVQGTTYAQSLSVTGDDAAWKLDDGVFPPGLALDEDSGLLAGRPTLPGTYTFTIVASRGGVPSAAGSMTYTLLVIEQLRVTFAPSAGRQAEAYDYTPTITGGIPPYEVTIWNLPVGLTYDKTTGRITGTPPVQVAGQSLDLSVLDAGTPAGLPQQAVAARATLVIHPLAVSIGSPRDLPAAPIGQPYVAENEPYLLTATNGKQPYQWLPVTGALPEGLKLDNARGEIYGTPEDDATTQVFTLSVTDSDKPASTATMEFKLVVPVQFLAVTPPAATIDQPYEQVLGAIGGLPFRPANAAAHYKWELTVGQMPTGLKLGETTGIISGTPSAGATTQTFTIAVSDNDSPASQASQAFTIEVGS